MIMNNRTMSDAAHSFTPKRIDRRGAAEVIAEQLYERIASGRWQPGDRIPAEWELAEGYGVSRGTVREALRILASRSLVRSVRGAQGGTFVIAPPADVISAQFGDFIVLQLRTGGLAPAEVDEARRILERECVRLAAQRRSEEDLRAIEAPIARVEADPQMPSDEWLAADVELHTAIAGASDNAVLEVAMTAVHAARPRTGPPLRAVPDRDGVDPQTVGTRQRAILEAIRRQDPDEAERALEAHADYLDSLTA